MRWRDALALGRVSNLPTVWTNVVAGIVLAGGSLGEAPLAALLLALSLFYVGGMYLNDAFDAEIDARERPERPIPAGRVTRRAVFAAGFAMLAAGVAILAAIGFLSDDGTGPWSPLAGLALAATIVFYDVHHKANPLGPLVMGVCRVLVYVAAGLAIAVPLPASLLLAAAALLCYLIGLTYTAKQETLGRVENLWPLAFLGVPVLYGAWLALAEPAAWPFWLAFVGWVAFALRYLWRRRPGDVPRAVVSLIAGIALYDALIVSAQGALVLAVAAVGAFGLTLVFQRYVAGT